MEEDELKELYEDWNKKKQELNFSKRTNLIYFKEGDIWWCSLLYQIRNFNKKRFQRKLGELDKKDILNIKRKLEQLLKFS